MFFSAVTKCLTLLFVALAFSREAQCVDLSYTEIYTVKDGTRFTELNPDAVLVPFNKVRNVKGNFVFTSGERINGDRLIVTFLDETQFTKAEDIEVILKYPAKGQSGSTISAVEIYVDLSADDADAYFFEGGISKKFASILLKCDQTRHFTYEIFIYGY